MNSKNKYISILGECYIKNVGEDWFDIGNGNVLFSYDHITTR